MTTSTDADFRTTLDEGALLSDSSSIEILHIEDEAEFADIVSTFLEREREHFDITTKNDPEAGLAALGERNVDCIISDYDMPGATGLDVLEQVREDHPHLPFILFTGKGNEEIASEAITAGVTEYLQKSGGSDQYTVLANRIEQAVAKHRAEKQVERGFHALETAHDGISLLSEDGEFIYLNEAYADTVGYDRDELTGEHFETLFPDENLDVAYDEIIPAARETGEWQGETVFLTRDNGPITVDHLLSFTSEGTMVCTISEATGSEELSEELSLRARAMDEAPIGITISDPSRGDNPLVYANDEFTEMTGYDSSEIIGENCRFLQGEGTHEEPVAEMRQAIGDESPVAVELRNYRKDGEMFWNRVTIAPLYGEDGDLEHFVGFQEDVTPHRELVEEFSNLGSVLSHDMQSPLETVRGRLELAIESGDTEHAEAALSPLNRLGQLIDDVAEVLESGSIISEREEIDVARVGEEVWSALDRCSEEDTIDIECSLTMEGDKDAVRRMFDNLFRNSIEHGETPVEVRVGELEDGGFYIEDNGPGIPEEHREQIFEHGFSMKSDHGKTGMGMASVQQVVFAHGWRIDVSDAKRLDGVRFEIRTD